MRLIIDDERARTSCVGGTPRPPGYREGGVILPITPQQQMRPNWCWAAIAAVIADYYGAALPQTDVVARVLGLDAARVAADPELGGDSDVERRLDEALTAVDRFGHWSFGKPMFDRVRFEVHLGHPFAARIGWHDGAAHYVLVHGYIEEGRRLAIFDPLHGPQTVEHASFPSSYRRGGAWTETLWTRPARAHDPAVDPGHLGEPASERL